MSNIDVKKIYKSFNNNAVLENISFNIEDGEIVSILGPSGCGKTTLLKCILGLEVPNEGDIYIDTSKQSDWLKLKRIAYVPQKYSNFNHLTVEQNVSIAIKKSEKNKKDKVDNILKSVGLDRLKKLTL